jgi:hypothetical protein
MALGRLRFDDFEEDEPAPRLSKLKITASSPVGMVVGIVCLVLIPVFLVFVFGVTAVSVTAFDAEIDLGMDSETRAALRGVLWQGLIPGIVAAVFPGIGLGFSIRQLRFERSLRHPSIGTAVTGIVLNSIVLAACLTYAIFFIIALSNWSG